MKKNTWKGGVVVMLKRHSNLKQLFSQTETHACMEAILTRQISKKKPWKLNYHQNRKMWYLTLPETIHNTSRIVFSLRNVEIGRRPYRKSLEKYTSNQNSIELLSNRGDQKQSLLHIRSNKHTNWLYAFSPKLLHCRCHFSQFEKAQILLHDSLMRTCMTLCILHI